MRIGPKLLASFLVVICLTLLMYGVSYWGTSEIRAAHQATLEAMTTAAQVKQQSTQLSSMLQKIESVRSSLNIAMGGLLDSMLQNDPHVELLNDQQKDLFNDFLTYETVKLTELLKLEPVVSTELVGRYQIMQKKAEHLQKIWQPRHEGLAEELSDLKRALTNWTLKIANLLFIQSSIDELLYEEVTDTPIEAFKASRSYQAYVHNFPELRQALENASRANEKLYALANQLDDLAFSSKWEEARLFYRDHFPPTIKSIMVDLDRVVSMENRTLRTQKKAVTLLNKELKTEVNGLLGELARLQEQLHQRQQSLHLALSEAQDNILISSQNMEKQINRSDNLSLIIAAFVIVFGLALAFLTTRGITQPLKLVNQMLTNLELGNLDARLELTRKDELGMLGRALDTFADNLQNEVLSAFKKLAEGNFTFVAQGLIRNPLARTNASLNGFMGEIRTAGIQVATRSQQISDNSQLLSQGAAEQASALVEISSSLSSVVNQSRANADNAQHAQTLTGKARQAADGGSREMEQVVQAMAEINHASQEISRIMKVIDEIAFQTNLLALNAAVEAARAGQHGKGFAVVAEEVRALANRCSQAASEIGTLIESSQRKVDSGATLAHSAAVTLEGIVGGISQVAILAEEIANASQEQSQGIEEVNLGLAQIDKTTQQTTANAEESAAAAEDLAWRSGQLQGMLETFELEGNQNIQLDDSGKVA